MNLVPPRSIPIWEYVRTGIATAWAERRALAAPATFLFLAQLFVLRFLPPARVDWRNPPIGAAWNDVILGFAAAIVMSLLFFALNVGLQRRLLLGEKRSGMQLLSFGPPFWRTFGASLLIVLVALVVALGIGLPMGLAARAIGPGPNVAVAIVGVPILFYLLFRSTMRLVLTLPAAAVGLPDRTRRVWDASRSIWWHLLAIVLLYFAIGLVLQIPTFILGGIDALASEAGDMRPGWITAIYSAALQVAANVCPAVTWALCYRQVFGDAGLITDQPQHDIV